MKKEKELITFKSLILSTETGKKMCIEVEVSNELEKGNTSTHTKPSLLEL